MRNDPLRPGVQAIRQQLLDWLDAGAPGHTFDMQTGLTTCGTTCCIAGFVALIVAPEIINAKGEEVRWDDVRDKALHALQLPDLGDSWFSHPLFNSIRAPRDCSAAAAARAARFAFKDPHHPDPWIGLVNGRLRRSQDESPADP